VRRKLVQTPLGLVPLVFTASGLRAVGMPAVSAAEAEAWAADMGARDEADDPLAQEVAMLLQRYGAGIPTSFLSIPLDWEAVSDFCRRVLEEVRLIPWGEVRTYSWLALMVGQPRGARAVGQALARNPFPIVVPCHRMVGRDGSLRGYGGGIEWKERLLRLEGLEVGLHLAPRPQKGPQVGY
jgi:methylated-DNA-[protein]-cysteine S-methyltransferase